jgi:hypothetical protein
MAPKGLVGVLRRVRVERRCSKRDRKDASLEVQVLASERGLPTDGEEGANMSKNGRGTAKEKRD